MNTIQTLRQLEKAVLRSNHESALALFDEVGSDLTREQRLQILTGWNEYLRTGNDAAIIEEIRNVCRQLES